MSEALPEPPSLAHEKDILTCFRRDMRLCGLVGEEKTAKLIYLAITSRVLNKPISVGVKGHSASGKSYTVGQVVDFFPRDAVIEFTSMSEKALIYRQGDYKHKTLLIYELTGLREGNDGDQTSYFIRTLLSEGRLNYEVTVKKDGEFTTKRITKMGPTNLVFTTTKTRVHSENETRILSLNTDDGTEQTKRVLAALAVEDQGVVNKGEWRDFQAWLQGAETRVTIPYARKLAEKVPPIAVRLRRDFSTLLALIQSHAILHQLNRDRDEKGRIVATLDDYRAVRDLVGEIIAETIGATVSDTVKETVRAVRELSKNEGASSAQIQRFLRIDQSNASRRLRRVADNGYIRNLETRRGRPGRWVIGDPLPEEISVLPEPEKLSISSQHTAYAHTSADSHRGKEHEAEASKADWIRAYEFAENGKRVAGSNDAIDPSGSRVVFGCYKPVETDGK